MKLPLSFAAVFFAANFAHAQMPRVEFQRDFAPSEGWTKPVEKPLRDELCLNGRWQFQPLEVPRDYKRNAGTPPELSLPAADKWDAAPIKIPSPWNVNTWGAGRDVGAGTARPYAPSSLYYPSYPARWDNVEMGWLRRSFRVPQNWRNRRLVLHFEAIAGEAQIFVNGQKAGGHFDSFLPLEIDVTNLVKPNADNELLVGVRGAHLFDELSAKYPKMRSPYPVGSNTDHLRGLWQDVFLLALPAVRVSDVFIKPLVSRDTLEAEVTLRNDTPRAVNLSIGGAVHSWGDWSGLIKVGTHTEGQNTLTAPEPTWRLGAAVMNFAPQKINIPAGQSVVFTLRETVRGRLKLWSPDAPNLCGLVLSVNEGNASLDKKFTRFGWREFKISGRDLLLNGQKIQLYGDLLHPFGPLVNSRRYVWAWYRFIKDMHGNAVRPHAQPHPRTYLDLADEMGLLVLDETALFGSSVKLNFESPQAWPRFEKHFDDLVLRDRNHPSVFGWSFGNELFAIFHLNEVGKAQSDEWYAKLGELGKRAQKLDPTREWISCDGDEDLRGASPVWNRHFGHGLHSNLPDINKPLMIGESGGSYYARPGQLATFNGERAYENYAGRNEALALDVYQNIVQVARPKLAFYSPAETAWFGAEHLPFGYRDFSRLPNESDGVWFKPFEENKPGVQIERLPPFVATLNPGFDASLPLYKPLAMFEAQKAAQNPGAPLPFSAPIKRTPKSEAPAPTIESVLFIGDGATKSALQNIGVPLGEARSEAPSKLLILDAQNITNATLPQAKNSIAATLQSGGTVLVLAHKKAPLLSDILPVPATQTPRTATALLPREASKITAGLALPDLYFAEDLADKYIVKNGLGDDFALRGRVLLEASNTDWSLFNNQPENSKGAALVLYEKLRKPSGAALVELAQGNGKILLSAVDINSASPTNVALWRRLFANLEVKLSDGVLAQELANQAFNRDGALIRALTLGIVPVGEDVDVRSEAIKENAPMGGTAWRKREALGQDRYNFRQFRPPPGAEGGKVFFSFWISSPTDLSDPLVAGPDAPKVGMRFYFADELKFTVNGQELQPNRSEFADYRQLVTFSQLPLKKGWNHLLLQVTALSNDSATQGTLAARLFCDRPAFLEQIKTSIAPGEK